MRLTKITFQYALVVLYWRRQHVRLISANTFLIGYIYQLVFTARALHDEWGNNQRTNSIQSQIPGDQETNGKEIFGNVSRKSPKNAGSKSANYL